MAVKALPSVLVDYAQDRLGHTSTMAYGTLETYVRSR